jgi:putative polyketide hydroxylase
VPPDGKRAYRPQARAGARAPLVRFEGPAGEELPTTDLFETEFVLLAGAGSGWRAASEMVASRGVPICCLEVGVDLLGADEQWSRAYEIRSGGAVLVRPDGHVALHVATGPLDPAATLAEAFEQILGD